MSDQSQTEGAAPESEPTQEQQEQSPPEWLAPIQERMNELGEQTGRMADQLAGLYQEPPPPQQQQQQQQQRTAEDEYDFFDDDGDLTPEGAQALIDKRVDDRLNAALAERDARSALTERDEAFDALREEIPALADEKTAARLVRETAQYLTEHGRDDVIETPMFIDLIEDRFYREQYRDRIAAEREQAAEQEVVLESASGASQPQTGKEPDWGERIVKAAESLRPQI